MIKYGHTLRAVYYMDGVYVFRLQIGIQKYVSTIGNGGCAVFPYNGKDIWSDEYLISYIEVPEAVHTQIYRIVRGLVGEDRKCA